jgi:hypothetical protein
VRPNCKADKYYSARKCDASSQHVISGGVQLESSICNQCQKFLPLSSVLIFHVGPGELYTYPPLTPAVPPLSKTSADFGFPSSAVRSSSNIKMAYGSAENRGDAKER